MAVLICFETNIKNRDIYLTTRQGLLQHINELNHVYGMLVYPLFGANLGFQLDIRDRQDTMNILIREYYAYRFYTRKN